MDKLETVSANLRKLRKVVDNGIVQESEYNKLVKKCNSTHAIDANKLVKKLTTI